MDFDYFYNREAERFNFLKVPEILVDGEEFRGLSAYIKSTGKTYKDHKATILSWFHKDQGRGKEVKTSNIPTWEEYDKGEHL